MLNLVQRIISIFSHVSIETEYSAVRVINIQFSEADLLSVYLRTLRTISWFGFVSNYQLIKVVFW